MFRRALHTLLILALSDMVVWGQSVVGSGGDPPSIKFIHEPPPVPKGVIATVGSSRLRVDDACLAIGTSTGSQYILAVGPDWITWFDGKTGDFVKKGMLEFPRKAPSRISLAQFRKEGDRIDIYALGHCFSVNTTTGKIDHLRFFPELALASPVALSPDGDVLVGRLREPPNFASKEMIVVDRNTGKRLFTLPSPMEFPTDLSVSPGGKNIGISLSVENVAYVVDSQTGDRVLEVKGEGTRTRWRTGFSPDGKQYRIHTPGEIQVWDIEKKTKRWSWKPKRFGFYGSPAYSPDGRWLATASTFSGNVYLFDAANGKIHTEVKPDAFVFNIFFAHEGLRVFADGRGEFRELRFGGDQGTGLNTDPPSGAFLRGFAEKDRLLKIGQRENHFYDWKANKLIRTDIPRDIGKPGIVCPLGKRIACVEDGALEVWDLVANRIEWTKPLETAIAYLPKAFSPDGQLLIAGLGGEETFIWNAANGNVVHRLKTGVNKFLATSPDGRWLVTTPNQITFSFWDLRTGKIHDTQTFREFGEAAIYLDFSPDGSKVCVRTSDRRFAFQGIFDVEAKERIAMKDPSNELEGSVMKLSPNGRMLCSDSFDVAENKPREEFLFWECATGEVRRKIYRDIKAFSSIAFSERGDFLAAQTRRHPIYIWDIFGKHQMPETPWMVEEAAVLWENLGNVKAEPAFKAMCHLIQHPQPAVAFLKARMSHPKLPDGETFGKRVADLDAPEFEVRKTAHDELERLAPFLLDKLTRATSVQTTVEMRQRLARIIEIGKRPHPERLRQIRILEILEQLEPTLADPLLRIIAAGPESATWSREARQLLRSHETKAHDGRP